MKKLLFLTVFFLFAVVAFSARASILQGAIAGWDGGYLKVTNVRVGDTLYWGRFAYDSANDSFYLVDYGEDRPSNTVRICFTLIDDECSNMQLIFEKKEGTVRGTGYFDEEHVYPLHGTCSGNVCDLYDERGCHLRVEFLEGGKVRIDALPDEMSTFEFYQTCNAEVAMGLLNDDAFKVIESEYDFSAFDHQVDSVFESIMSGFNVQAGLVKIEDGKVCFGIEQSGDIINRKKCYLLNENTLQLVSESNSNVLNPEDLERYGAVCELPFIIYPAADTWFEKEYPMLEGNYLYVIRMKNCDEGAAVKLSLTRNGNRYDLGYLDDHLKVQDAPFYFEGDEIEVTDMNDPLPGQILGQLKDEGIEKIELQSICRDGTILENKRFLLY